MRRTNYYYWLKGRSWLKADTSKQVFETGVGAQIIPTRVDFQVHHPLISVGISLLQRCDCLIPFAESQLNKADKVRRYVTVFRSLFQFFEYFSRFLFSSRIAQNLPQTCQRAFIISVRQVHRLYELGNRLWVHSP